MNIIKYIWRNVTRNKLRSLLTVLSVGFCLALLTVLNGYMAMQSLWSTKSVKYHRIVVMNIQGFSGMLPIAYVDKIRRDECVAAAVPYSWFGGDLGEEKMPFAQFGTDPAQVFQVWDEYKIDPAQVEAFQKNRRGCVVDRQLAEKRNWKIGEHVRLKGTYYPVNLDLELVGVFDAPLYTGSLWFNWYYLDEELKKSPSARATGNAGTIFAKSTSTDVMADMSKRIDDQFSSSANPTRTQTESAFAQMFADMIGDVRQYISNIGLAVVFSLTLVGANAMAMSMRERTTEIAVLKAIGFTRGRVLVMVLGEACLIAVVGGVFGIAMGCLVLEGVHGIVPTIFRLSITEMIGPWLAVMLAIALGIGLASGIVPAIRASQLSVVDGLRRVI